MCTPTRKPMAARDLETRDGHPNLPDLENSEAESGAWGAPALELSHGAHHAPSGPAWGPILGLQVTCLNAWTPFPLCFTIIYMFL